MIPFDVDINASEARKVIPIGEDIVYSTILHGYKQVGNTQYRWPSHVLFTTKGLAYYEFMRGKGNELRYAGYQSIKIKKFGISFIGLRQRTYSFKHNKKTEIKKEFKARVQQIMSQLRPIIEEGKKFWDEQFPIKKDYKSWLKNYNREFKAKNIDI